MRKTLSLLFISLILLLLQSCDFIAGIFQTGFWAGVILVVIVVIIIVVLIVRKR